MGAFENLPVIETLPPLARNEVRPAAPVHVPLADAAGVVAVRLQLLGEGDGVGVQLNIIEENPVRLRALAGEHRRAHRRTHGHARDGLGEVDALALEAVEVRRLHIRIGCVAERLRAPLIGDDQQDVWFFSAGGEPRKTKQTQQENAGDTTGRMDFHKNERRSCEGGRTCPVAPSLEAHLCVWRPCRQTASRGRL